MKYLKIILISILGYIIVSLLNDNHLYLTENIGSLWLNIKYFYILIIGFIFGVLFLKFNNLSKFSCYLFGLLIIIILINSPNDIFIHEITLYLFLVSVFFLSILKFKLI